MSDTWKSFDLASNGLIADLHEGRHVLFRCESIGYCGCIACRDLSANFDGGRVLQTHELIVRADSIALRHGQV